MVFISQEINRESYCLFLDVRKWGPCREINCLFRIPKILLCTDKSISRSSVNRSLNSDGKCSITEKQIKEITLRGFLEKTSRPSRKIREEERNCKSDVRDKKRKHWILSTCQNHRLPRKQVSSDGSAIYWRFGRALNNVLTHFRGNLQDKAFWRLRRSQLEISEDSNFMRKIVYCYFMNNVNNGVEWAYGWQMLVINQLMQQLYVCSTAFKRCILDTNEISKSEHVNKYLIF